jgi:hypothetical protein
MNDLIKAAGFTEEQHEKARALGINWESLVTNLLAVLLEHLLKSPMAAALHAAQSAQVARGVPPSPAEAASAPPAEEETPRAKKKQG